MSSTLAHALLIFGSVLVLEDVAVLGAALLVVNRMVSLSWAAGACFSAIWIGDVGLYALAFFYGRSLLEKPWFKRLFGEKLKLDRVEGWFQKHGVMALLLSRPIPPARLPAYLVSGVLRVPAVKFLPITALTCTVWVAGLFWLSYHVGMMAIAEFEMFKSEAAKLGACIAVAGALGWALRKFLKSSMWRKLARWEFWPPAVFYLPVAVKYVSLAIQHRSLTLPTLANPGMYAGGLIGESKFETLSELARANPDLVAPTYLVQFESFDQQFALILKLRQQESLSYPLVFKPDIGQRGFGFKLVHSDDEARAWVNRFKRDLLVQKYAPGPNEVGVFYYRLPGEEHGRIFSITEKIFPEVVGDGQSTLEELIRQDPRASIVAETYLQRFGADGHRVLASGESMRLVEAGNHCQGAIFLNGGRLFSVELEQKMDAVSKSLGGFFVGRYDIRYASEEALRQGKDFWIIELNGASSEATSIYDPHNSLRNAYRTLFRQWEIVFAIAAENRKRGLTTTPLPTDSAPNAARCCGKSVGPKSARCRAGRFALKTIWRNWISYRQQAALNPVSD
jgi:membrane protein DedA with SNARE-associated domain